MLTRKKTANLMRNATQQNKNNYFIGLFDYCLIIKIYIFDYFVQFAVLGLIN